MVDVHRVFDVSVVDVEGELSRYNVNDLDSALNSLSRSAHHNVVLDFERLKHLDYRLVQRIADRIVEFQCDGGDLKVAGASEYIRHILEAMGLEEEVYESVTDALLSFRRSEVADTLQ